MPFIPTSWKGKEESIFSGPDFQKKKMLGLVSKGKSILQ